MCKTKAARARQQSGLSLIELMVALVIGLIFAIAVLIVQSKLTQQNLQMTDVMERDTQARAALDLITRSLSNAGFMVGGGVQSPCAAVLAYNAGLATPVFSQYPVTAASQPLALPVANPPAGTNNNPNNYPPAGSANVTQLISIRSTDSALQTPGSGLIPTSVVQNSTTNALPGQGALHATKLPLSNTTGMKPGDTALLRMPLNGRMVCFRVPIVNVGPGGSPSSTYITSKSAQLFPSTGYDGFKDAMRKAGLLASGQSLSNANFVRSQLIDFGPSATSTQHIEMFYVASGANNAGNPLPMLMRATVNAADDSLIGQPAPIAAGIVSLQALFGVDETNAGAVTNYLSWNDVVSGGYSDDVRSVLFALVSRSLQANPSSPAVATVAVPSPVDHGGFGPDKFTDYVPDAASQHYRYTVIESEVALRNLLWPH
jgi:type IV pilus assembly protein PilW